MKTSEEGIVFTKGRFKARGKELFLTVLFKYGVDILSSFL